MKKRHYTIPVFLPDVACPFECIYCNQKNISGKHEVPMPQDVSMIIEKHLATIPKQENHIELGFFGGSFTGLPVKLQEQYLAQAQPYLEGSVIKGIRLSTRPDLINENNLRILKKHSVTSVEIGAQSFDDAVLKASGRGHTAQQIIDASQMIVNNGFRLGLQMMTGLPCDTLEKTLQTAEHIVQCGASETRIYPVLVIRATALELLYNKGLYTPLTLEEAIIRCAEVYRIFENKNITILRMGLHPSEGLISKTSLIAGPFHVSFKELVLTRLWEKDLEKYAKSNIAENIALAVSEEQLKHAIGYQSKNRRMLEKYYKKVTFSVSSELHQREFYANHN